LASNKNAQVRFYSRSLFSELSKLREYAATQSDEESYRANLSKEHQKPDAALLTKIVTQTSNLSTYEFVCRTSFEISSELVRMETLLHERLRFMVSNSISAFNALWKHLDDLGGRMGCSSLTASPQHRLTKEDLKIILQEAGAILTPTMNLVEVRKLFTNTSAIGRTWQRKISGQHTTSPVINVKELTPQEKQLSDVLIKFLLTHTRPIYFGNPTSDEVKVNNGTVKVRKGRCGFSLTMIVYGLIDLVSFISLTLLAGCRYICTPMN